MGDRSGGREVKGASLKKSKKNPGGVNARGKKAEKVYSGPAESAVTPSPGPELYFDCGAALLSRQFERDRDRVLERARTDGNVAAIVLWFSDVEKQQLLADVCKDNSGLCYNVVGVHPDNIDKTNKRSHETWMLKVEELARKPECVGILSGYNLGRDVATHFAQESLLKTSCALADKLMLSLVLHIADGDSLLKCIEILKTEGWTTDSIINSESISDRRVILHDAVTACGGDQIKLQTAVSAGFICSLSGAGICDADEEVRTKARVCVAQIPIGQMLVCTDSPWRTPQNLPDTYLRTLRNEPSNLPSIVTALSEAIGTNLKDLGHVLRINSLRAFGMDNDDNDEGVENGDKDNQPPQKKEIKIKQKEEDNEIDGVSKGKKKSKAALLQIFAQNDKKKKEQANNCKSSGSESEEEFKVQVPVQVQNVDPGSTNYSCHKCRASLFSQKDVVTHALDAVRTVFKVGEEGLCKSTVFLSFPYNSHNSDVVDDRKTKESKETKKSKSKSKDSFSDINSTEKSQNDLFPNLCVRGDTVECTVCGMKLGKYAISDAPCPCGILVPGPALRINSTKVDIFDSSLNAEILAARSIIEAEKLRELDENGEIEDNKGNKKDKKKKMKSDNKGNFSSYRNKSFVKNASRVPKGEDEKVGTENGNEDDSDGESDSDSEDEVEIVNTNSKKSNKKNNKKTNKNNKLLVPSDSESDSDD